MLALRCAQPTLKSVLLVINILGDCNRHFESFCVEAIYQICPEHIWLRFVQKKKPSQEKKKGQTMDKNRPCRDGKVDSMSGRVV